MKKISSLLGVALLLIIIVPFISFGQKNQNKIKMFIKDKKEINNYPVYQTQYRGILYPHQAIVYVWNGSGWELNGAEKYIYNSDGKNMFTYKLAPDFSDTFEKETTFYDEYGFKTYESYEYKSGPGNWVQPWGSRSTLTYYAPGKLESRIDEYWETDNKWHIAGKTLYTHNASGLVIDFIDQVWDTIQANWINSDKYEFLYDGNNKNYKAIGYYWIDNKWLQAEQIIVSWFVFNPYELNAEDMDSAEMQEWDSASSKFVNVYKMNVVRDANGGSIETDYDWNDLWVPSSRYTEKHDASKNNIGIVEENWNGTGWDIQFEDEYLLTYVSGNVTEKITKTWQQGDPPGVLTNMDKFVYSEFNAMKENKIVQFKTYPQPFNNFLVIEIPENLKQNTTVLVSDLNGKTMMSQILSNSSQLVKLDVSALAAGSYILTLQSSNTKISKLVLKL